MNIPIFPLRTVLFSTARMPLQIFEPRYIDMVKYCLKTQTPFGIVRICHGSEVVNAGLQESLDIEFVGTLATIVDFDALPNNRLKIIVEGGRRFTIEETAIASDQLINAQVQLAPPEMAQPLATQFTPLAQMLAELAAHDSITALGYPIDLNNTVSVGHQLASLLPIDSALQQDLLEQQDPIERLELLAEIIAQLQD